MNNTQVNEKQEEHRTRLEAENARLKEQVTDLEQQLFRLDASNTNQKATLDYYAGYTHQLEELNTFLNGKFKRLQALEASASWRLGNGIVRVARKIIRPGSWLARVVAAPLRGLQRLVRRRKAVADEVAEKAKNTYGTPAAPVHKPSILPRRPMQRFALPAFEDPEVSIIIPAHNQFAYTYRCIESIMNTVDDVSYEVILADDVSTDRTRRIGKLIKHLHIVRNEKNLGFLLNCNKAAATARGRYLVFLNNDTLVHAGWLQSLYDLMQQDETIGVAGSKLVYPDGTLQEAGGIIWRDASGWNYGRGKDPEASEFNYIKECDYVSGASIMVRRELWEMAGGFDERFAPAYYEDTDLCFTARSLGWRVVYQPLSVVTHFEGVSHGTDLEAGEKHHQVENREKFLEKWRETLEAEHYAEGDHVLRARDRTRNKKIMLVIDHYVPTYDRDAGSRSLHCYIQLFTQNGWHVILMPDNFHRSEYTQHYQEMGVEVLYGPWFGLRWKQWIQQNAREFDAALVHRPNVAMKYMDCLKDDTDARVIYYGADLHFLREQRQYEITGDEDLLKTAANWRKLELSLMRQADVALYPSYVEEEVIRDIAPDVNVMTVPLYVFEDLPQKPYNLEGRDGLLFVGGFNHPPNVDAAVWLVKEIMPLVWEKHPDVALHIVGSSLKIEVEELAGPKVTVHGFVEDEELNGLLATCRMSVVPLRYGAGLKGKVIEAMAAGIPIVTTPIGAEGIKNTEGFLAVEDTTEDLARRISALYGDKAALATMVEGGYRYIEETFSAKAARQVFDKALAQ